jgi:hypothetical protein
MPRGREQPKAFDVEVPDNTAVTILLDDDLID